MSKKITLNKKAFAATRALGKGPDHDKRWDYMHVSKNGVICTDTSSLIRVSLPDDQKPTQAQIFALETLDEIRPKTGAETVTMPEGLEAKSSGQFSVPNFDCAIPPTSAEVANITITAKALIDLLKAATEVTDHSLKLVRLRICQVGKAPMLRIDAHREEGAQEFCGVLMGTIYEGVCIPGDKKKGEATETVAPNEDIDEAKLNLPLVDGRKFRDLA